MLHLHELPIADPVAQGSIGSDKAAASSSNADTEDLSIQEGDPFWHTRLRQNDPWSTSRPRSKSHAWANAEGGKPGLPMPRRASTGRDQKYTVPKTDRESFFKWKKHRGANGSHGVTSALIQNLKKRTSFSKNPDRGEATQVCFISQQGDGNLLLMCEHQMISVEIPCGTGDLGLQVDDSNTIIHIEAGSFAEMFALQLGDTVLFADDKPARGHSLLDMLSPRETHHLKVARMKRDTGDDVSFGMSHYHGNLNPNIAEPLSYRSYENMQRKQKLLRVNDSGDYFATPRTQFAYVQAMVTQQPPQAKPESCPSLEGFRVAVNQPLRQLTSPVYSGNFEPYDNSQESLFAQDTDNGTSYLLVEPPQPESGYTFTTESWSPHSVAKHWPSNTEKNSTEHHTEPHTTAGVKGAAKPDGKEFPSSAPVEPGRHPSNGPEIPVAGFDEICVDPLSRPTSPPPTTSITSITSPDHSLSNSDHSVSNSASSTSSELQEKINVKKADRSTDRASQGQKLEFREPSDESLGEDTGKKEWRGWLGGRRKSPAASAVAAAAVAAALHQLPHQPSRETLTQDTPDLSSDLSSVPGPDSSSSHNSHSGTTNTSRSTTRPPSPTNTTITSDTVADIPATLDKDTDQRVAEGEGYSPREMDGAKGMIGGGGITTVFTTGLSRPSSHHDLSRQSSHHDLPNTSITSTPQQADQSIELDVSTDSHMASPASASTNPPAQPALVAPPPSTFHIPSPLFSFSSGVSSSALGSASPMSTPPQAGPTPPTPQDTRDVGAAAASSNASSSELVKPEGIFLTRAISLSSLDCVQQGAPYRRHSMPQLTPEGSFVTVHRDGPLSSRSCTSDFVYTPRQTGAKIKKGSVATAMMYFEKLVC